MSYSPLNEPKYDNRLEAVIVCLNYGDFLAETLPVNLGQVDRLVVVTSPADLVTREVCRKWSVECVTTDIFGEKGEPFNKGAAINVGLGALRQLGWILQLDADIALPLTFRNMLDKAFLQPDCIYGAERLNVVGYARWEKLRNAWFKEPQFSYRFLVSTPADLPLGATVIHKQWGYTPIGYFQLWHSRYMREHELRYPETEGSAECTDVQWAIRWPRVKRQLLPTVKVYHLESEPAPLGANWHGRTTKPFTRSGAPLQVVKSTGYTGYTG
jgi:hypothetical protein